MLDCEQLEEIIDKITIIVTRANRSGTLNELLDTWGLSELTVRQSSYETYKDGKIVVIGGSEVKERELTGIIKSLGLDIKRFEFCLDYNETKSFNYRKLRYAPNYRLVLMGPTPHSSTGKLDSGSVIAEMQNNEGYPRIEVLRNGSEVKISKSNFRNTLEKLKIENYI